MTRGGKREGAGGKPVIAMLVTKCLRENGKMIARDIQMKTGLSYGSVRGALDCARKHKWVKSELHHIGLLNFNVWSFNEDDTNPIKDKS